MSEIELSILMPTLKSRSSLVMASQINEQIERLSAFDRSQVQFLIEIDDGEKTSGQKRQTLVDRSRGKRICFVDDDDFVAPDYVPLLLKTAQEDQTSSVITFDLHYKASRRRHGRSRIFEERWEFGIWKDERKSGKMSANHLCAWKRHLATMVAWDPVLGYADDQVWYQPLHNHPDLVLTSNHIKKELYFYRPTESTANGTSERRQAAIQYVGQGLRCFYQNNEILIETRRLGDTSSGILVRNSKNALLSIPENSNSYFTVRVQ